VTDRSRRTDPPVPPGVADPAGPAAPAAPAAAADSGEAAASAGAAVRAQPCGPAGGPPDLAVLQRRLADFAAARHWQPYHTPKNLAAALSVEAAELLEIFQWLTPEQAAAVMDDDATAHRVRDEVADVLAYLLQFCQVLGVDVLAALAAKIDRNELRFPRPAHPSDPSHPTG
jgi:NTP pyrophosphatase (non-canonical NTP hydrolase)